MHQYQYQADGENGTPVGDSHLRDRLAQHKTNGYGKQTADLTKDIVRYWGAYSTRLGDCL